ncbi:MAG: DUF493 family protein [Syntrophales bacterium]|jgi:putative lipoic acid-binding regulatory protein|nr:DUF493 family protein [Syntrophales bacterium]
MKKNMNSFKRLLDEHYGWPCAFPFKFIMSAEKLPEILAFFPGEDYRIRSSETGKYISVTIHKHVSSSEEVARIYELAGKVRGVVCL